MTRPIPNVVPSYSHCSALRGDDSQPKSSSMSCLGGPHSEIGAPSFTAAPLAAEKNPPTNVEKQDYPKPVADAAAPHSREPSTKTFPQPSGTRIRAFGREPGSFRLSRQIFGFRCPVVFGSYFTQTAARSPLASAVGSSRLPPFRRELAQCFFVPVLNPFFLAQR